MIIKIYPTDVDHPLYAQPMIELHNSIFGEMLEGSPAYYHPVISEGVLIWGMETIELTELDSSSEDVVFIDLDDTVVFLLVGYQIVVPVIN